MDVLVNVLPFVLIALVFWLLIIRPAARNQRQTREMQSALGVGDRIITTSGIFATVSAIEDDHLVIEVADGVALKIVRAAVGSVLREDIEPADGDRADDSGDALDTPVNESSEES